MLISASVSKRSTSMHWWPRILKMSLRLDGTRTMISVCVSIQELDDPGTYCTCNPSKLWDRFWAVLPTVGGQQGQFVPGPQCKGAPEQCRTCSNTMRSSVTLQSSFLRAWFCCIFDWSQPALCFAFYAADANYLTQLLRCLFVFALGPLNPLSGPAFETTFGSQMPIMSPKCTGYFAGNSDTCYVYWFSTSIYMSRVVM